jgi:hypothetical protein
MPASWDGAVLAEWAAWATTFSRNGRARRDASLARAAQAEARGNLALADFHRQAAELHEAHRVHEADHAAMAEALSSGCRLVDYDRQAGPRSSAPALAHPNLPFAT